MIRQLPAELIREIAAGEVVTSPVDILKELLENALDAGATRLEVRLEAGGTRSLTVIDNGAGIPKAELPLTVKQHTTSKLESLTNISTLGFRGEGLYAIRHAARLAISSRPREQLGGATLTAEGDTATLEEHPAAAGTSVEVSRLFARLPARASALEHPSEERRKCTLLLGRYLLHHPTLNVRLLSDDNEKWNYAGGSFLEAAKFVWGPVTGNRLLNLAAQDESYTLSGLISRPELSRPRRDRLLLAVNGRPVDWEERWLKRIAAAYTELLAAGHYPVGILNLSVPPARLLVNTAPDKRRIRFLDEDAVMAFLEASVRGALAAHPLAAPLPSFEPLTGVTPAPRHSFPELTYVGSYRELYLLAEAEGTLWVIDQHAAHERILFEELGRRYRSEPALELSSTELVPLSQDEAAHYEANQALLEKIGVLLEPFGGDTWRVRRIPAFLAGQPALIAEVVKGSLGKSDVQMAWRKVLGRLACLPAIKAGHHLVDAEAQVLLDELRLCETPWACPHGRPTALVLSELELARKFGRSGTRNTVRVNV